MDKTIINTYLKKLHEKSQEQICTISGWQYQIAEYIQPGRYEPKGDWQPVTGRELLPLGQTIFMRTSFYFPDNLKTSGDQRDYLFIRIPNLEGYLRVNGEVYHGLDRNREQIPIHSDWIGSEVQLELELFSRETKSRTGDHPYFAYSKIVRVDKRIEAFYYDLLLASETLQLDETIVNRFSGNLEAAQRAINAAPTGSLKPRIMQAIDASLRNLDLSVCGEDFVRLVQNSAEILSKSLASINDGDLNGRISLIGHTHIDVAWLWQLKDTVRKCGHSFSNVLRLMEEYPEFTFTCSQPQLYAYTKKHYPELYEQIKARVASGSWELVGPMWVESDCNVISGESLIRQFLHGYQFFLKEFGKSSDICWLPDTFGFQPNMPQILKKSGIKNFFSYKLHWQARNRFPYGSFRWRGIDGSEVIASVPELYSGYNGKPTPAQLRYVQDANLQKDTLDNVIFTYGWGDGGGGPTREMVEYIRRMADYPSLPSCKLSKAEEFFSDLEKKSDLLPVWYGELYLETHRGTYTTHGHEKRANRKGENLLQTAEKLSSIARSAGYTPDSKVLNDAWEELLLLQFHDILPGSSIRQVYEDATQMYQTIFTSGNQVLEQAADFISGSGDITGPQKVVVLNSLSWERSGSIQIRLPRINGMSPRVLDSDGGQTPSHIVSVNENEVELRFVAEHVPSLGLRIYNIVYASEQMISSDTQKAASIRSDESGILVENTNYRMHVSLDGRIDTLYDKRAGRQVLSGLGNEFKLYLDGPQDEDAWNLYAEYRDREFVPQWQNKLEVEENSPLRTVIHLCKQTERIKIDQRIILDSSNERIDFSTTIDWQERNKLLKVGFPLAVLTPYMVCDTGFGSYCRPTVANTPFDKQKFEFVAHKWIDLSEGDYGISLLNDCKYGHSIQDNCVEISLLRSTSSPDETADLGYHEINYSLVPHTGDWRDALTAREGHDFNNPLMAFTGHYAAPRLPDGFSLMSTNNKNIIIDTIKDAWDGKGIIVRVYETNGNSGTAEITLNAPAECIVETDLMERPIGDPAAGATFSFSFGPYEIKSFRIISKS